MEYHGSAASRVCSRASSTGTDKPYHYREPLYSIGQPICIEPQVTSRISRAFESTFASPTLHVHIATDLRSCIASARVSNKRTYTRTSRRSSRLGFFWLYTKNRTTDTRTSDIHAATYHVSTSSSSSSSTGSATCHRRQWKPQRKCPGTIHGKSIRQRQVFTRLQGLLGIQLKQPPDKHPP